MHSLRDAPFAGGWGIIDWPEGFGKLNKSGAKKVQRKGYNRYQIVVRVQPLGNLREFAEEINKQSGFTKIGEPEESDKSILISFDAIGKTPMNALSHCTIKLDRILKKTGRHIVRISWDVREYLEFDGEVQQ